MFTIIIATSWGWDGPSSDPDLLTWQLSQQLCLLPITRTILVYILLGYFFFSLSSYESVILWSLPVRSSSFELVFLLGCLPLRLFSCEVSSCVVVFLWGRFTVRLSFCKVVFLSGCLPVRSSSCEVVFQCLWGCLPFKNVQWFGMHI